MQRIDVNKCDLEIRDFLRVITYMRVKGADRLGKLPDSWPYHRMYSSPLLHYLVQISEQPPNLDSLVHVLGLIENSVSLSSIEVGGIINYLGVCARSSLQIMDICRQLMLWEAFPSFFDAGKNIMLVDGMKNWIELVGTIREYNAQMFPLDAYGLNAASGITEKSNTSYAYANRVLTLLRLSYTDFEFDERFKSELFSAVIDNLRNSDESEEVRQLSFRVIVWSCRNYVTINSSFIGAPTQSEIVWAIDQLNNLKS